MFEAGLDPKTICMRTGHKSNAINNYIRESQDLQMEVSKILEPVVLAETESRKNDGEKQKEEISDEKIDGGEIDSAEKIGEVNNEVNNEKNEIENENERPITIELNRGSKKIKISL